DQNTLGGGIGGPIRKNKLFYYGLFSYNPLGQASTPASVTWAPTAAGYNLLNNMSNVSATNLGILKQYVPAAPVQDGNKITTVNGTPIPLGILPIVAPNFTNTYLWLVSVDYNLSDKDQIRSRYIDQKITTIDNVANLPVFWVNRPITRKGFTFTEFHSFRSNLVNEFRLAYNRYNSDTPVPDFQYPGLDVFPNIQIQDDLAIQIGPNTSAPQATIQNTYQAVENLSWTKGKHDLK